MVEKVGGSSIFLEGAGGGLLVFNFGFGGGYAILFNWNLHTFCLFVLFSIVCFSS